MLCKNRTHVYYDAAPHSLDIFGFTASLSYIKYEHVFVCFVHMYMNNSYVLFLFSIFVGVSSLALESIRSTQLLQNYTADLGKIHHYQAT